MLDLSELGESTNPVRPLPGGGTREHDFDVTRLVGAVLLEQSDEWAVSRRYMTLESIAPVSDNPTVKLPAVAA